MSFFDKFKNKAHAHLSLNICMLGARGVGKTTVLTSIFNDSRSKDGFARTRISMMAKPETRTELAEHRDQLLEAFSKRTDIAVIPPSKGEHIFKFDLGLLGCPPCVDLTVTDYPGEKLVQEPEYVSEKIRESEVVIIAIDAPYLMEDGGAYNEEKNQVALVTKFVEDNLDSFDDKLVMLVPLKCEKYLDLLTEESRRKNCSDEMLRLICDKFYTRLIGLLQSKEKVAVVVAPILTVGGVVLDRFVYDGQTHVSKFKFYDGKTADGSEAQYKPVFCSQPIVYLLSFVAMKYKRYRNKAGFFGMLLQSVFDFLDKNEDFLVEMVKVDKLRLKEGNGYKMICGSNLFYSKND